jgi:hypothetical protein
MRATPWEGLSTVQKGNTSNRGVGKRVQSRRLSDSTGFSVDSEFAEILTSTRVDFDPILPREYAIF